MISHNIIIEKPTVYVPPTYNYQQQQQETFRTRCIYQSQHAYDSFLETAPVKGQLITYARYTPITTFYQIHLVVGVEDDFSKVSVDYKGIPQSHLVVQISSLDDRSPWERWMAMDDMRLCTTDELQAMDYDKLQNNIKEYYNKYPSKKP